MLLAAAIVACDETRAIDEPTPRTELESSAPLLGVGAGGASPLAAASAAPPDAVASRCPDGMASIGSFCIDRYEGHLVTRRPSGALAVHPYFQRPEGGVRYEARSEPGAFPQAYISRVESQAACANVGKRLCSRAEWQRACMGPRGTPYPYGARREPQRCNTDKSPLFTLRFGPDTLRWRYEDFNDPALAQAPGFLAKTGEHRGCVGDEGVYDLVGNLHEWVSDTADRAFRARLQADGVSRSFQYWSPGNGVFMGGFFSTQAELGPGCTFTTIAHEPTYHDYSTGFRCCASASSE
jgi:formylglycine-generating enzyme